MKKYLRTHKIEVVINVEEVVSSIAAAQYPYINHPRGNCAEPIDELKLVILNDVVASAASAVYSHNFFVDREGPEGDLYSYYIRFRPCTREGIPIDGVTDIAVVFRISNHPSTSARKDGSTNSTLIIKSFVLGGEYYENSIQFIRAFNTICDRLADGDVTVLDEY